jgi:hypothetical protein
MEKIVGNDLDGAFKAMQPYLVISESEFQMAVLNTKTNGTNSLIVMVFR